MLAAVAYEGEERFRVEEIEVPEVGAGEVLVRVMSAGITRGLIGLWRWGQIGLLPATLGQQGAGVVAEIGPDVVGVRVGDRVHVHALLTCGHCSWCQADQENSCPQVSVIGLAAFGPEAMPLYERYHNGCLAEYVKIPSTNVVPIPDGVDFEAAGHVQQIAVSYHTMRRAGLRPGSTLVVNGATGATGSSCVVLAPIFGVTKVIAVSRTRAGLEPIRALAPELVETIALEDLDDDWEECSPWDGSGGLTRRIREVAGGYGPDAVVDFMPATPQVTTQSLVSMCGGGVIAITGGTPERLQIPSIALMMNNYEIRGSRGLVRRDATEVLALIGAGRIDPGPLTTHRFALTEVNEAMETIEQRKGSPRLVTIEPSVL